MPDTTLVHCGRDARPAVDHVSLRLGARRDGTDANLFLDVERVHRAFLKPIPSVDRDLMEVAAYVFAADQAVPRGGPGLPADGELGAGWRRRFCYHVPVRNPDVWRSAAVTDLLTATLGFLSDDEYEFHFRPLAPDADFQGTVRFDRAPYDGLIDEVALFSGGLDSLAGAVDAAVVRGRKVLLVNHRTNAKVSGRHHQLLAGLGDHARACRPVHIPVWLNKEKELGRSSLQRTRSFVYAAVAAAVARLVGHDRVWFYENGVVGLNLPLSAQVVGGRATRTTHPRVLNGFARLFGLLTGRPFAVENPFVWDTKADVVRRIAAAGCGPLIEFSSSCVETWGRTVEHPHCGACSQCVDRRFGVLAAGQAGHDPGRRYEVDLFTGPRGEGKARHTLAGYLARAEEVRQDGPAGFFRRHGEVGRVLAEFPGAPAAVAARVYALYLKHAREVQAVLRQGLAAAAPRLDDRSLDASCLVRLVVDPQSAPPLPSPPAGPRNVIARRGRGWFIRFAGGEGLFYPDDLGFWYLDHVLRTPDVVVPTQDLDAAVRGRQAAIRQRVRTLIAVAERAAGFAEGLGSDDAFDGRTRDELRAALGTIATLLDTYAGDGPDRLEVVDELRARRAAIEAYLRQGTRIGGKVRKLTDPVHRVRDRVGKAIRRAVAMIADEDRPLGAHLREPFLTLGNTVSYRPPTGTTWSAVWTTAS
ncbi:adenine nucleotide alpha hydrolase family protein [Limnoglobus roseus]|uniref:7-cyano-7-deazaguanine synthase n=1 Tax=Limnoglobus roseus TaxID=2598579 RepID=A0A5C1AG78_9BACT|nr:7-cyano-7-deazaguanine synthase [Limnoglobus roseus]QEL17635.1 7-cyano-7-deazaguanine synthase [Limnoglobus roseus]